MPPLIAKPKYRIRNISWMTGCGPSDLNGKNMASPSLFHGEVACKSGSSGFDSGEAGCGAIWLSKRLFREELVVCQPATGVFRPDFDLNGMSRAGLSVVKVHHLSEQHPAAAAPLNQQAEVLLDQMTLRIILIRDDRPPGPQRLVVMQTELGPEPIHHLARGRAGQA